MSFALRPAHLDDLAAIRDVCIRTGDAGGDAIGSHPADPSPDRVLDAWRRAWSPVATSSIPPRRRCRGAPTAGA